VEHAALARSLGIDHAIVNENGGMVRLAPGIPEIVETVQNGRLGLDGRRPVPLDGDIVRGRMRAIYNGIAVMTVVLSNHRNDPIELQMSTFGLLNEDEEAIAETVRRDVLNAIDDMKDVAYSDDITVQELVRQAARRTFRHSVGKKPLTSVHVVRRETGNTVAPR
jgi:ribonuclease J